MTKIKVAVYIIVGLSVLYFGAKYGRQFTVAEPLTNLATDHFDIFYYGIYTSEAESVAQSLEENYERIRNELGDADHQKLTVYIYPNRSDFNKKTGLLHGNATGTSRGPNEFHFIWTNWFNSLFPDDPVQTAIHEFSHCVQLNVLIKDAQSKFIDADSADFDRTFEAKFASEYPQWFWEAISAYEAKEINSLSVKYAMRGTPSLKYLSKSNQIYNVGYTIIEYIVATWGKEKLPLLIRSYVDLEGTLQVTEAEFEMGWHEFVADKY
jgi:hypothetical protein